MSSKCLDFNEKDEPQLFVQVRDEKEQGAYRPAIQHQTGICHVALCLLEDVLEFPQIGLVICLF